MQTRLFAFLEDVHRLLFGRFGSDSDTEKLKLERRKVKSEFERRQSPLFKLDYIFTPFLSFYVLCPLWEVTSALLQVSLADLQVLKFTHTVSLDHWQRQWRDWRLCTIPHTSLSFYLPVVSCIPHLTFFFPLFNLCWGKKRLYSSRKGNESFEEEAIANYL